MQTALVAIGGAFLLELGAVIFATGKLFQRVSDIDRWIREKTVETDRRLVRLEGNPGCTEEVKGHDAENAN